MKFKHRVLRLLLIINRKLKFKIARKEEINVVKDDNTIVGKFSTFPSDFDIEAEPVSVHEMKTSTPVKANPLKIIVLREVSHLKIYEEYEDIEPFLNYNNNNNDEKGGDLDDFDISDLTVYENLRINNINNFTSDQSDFSLESLEETGFKIYEDIGESFAVD